MKAKLLFFISIFLVLLVSGVSAETFYNNSFESDTNDWSEISSLAANGNFGRTTAHANTGSYSLFMNDTNSGAFYGIEQNVTQQNDLINITFHYYTNNFANDPWVIQILGDDTTFVPVLRFSNNGNLYHYDGSSYVDIGEHRISTWTEISWVFNASTGNYDVYEDGTKILSNGSRSTWVGSYIDKIELKSTDASSALTELFIDDLTISNFTAPTPISNETNESTESLVVNYQVGSVSTSTLNTNVTISDFDFNITTNNSPYYFTTTLQISAGVGLSKTVVCETLLNGTVVGTKTRTLASGSTGNIYIQTELLMNETNTYNLVNQCRKTSGAGTITIENAVIVGHLLVDSYGNIINYAYEKTTNVWSNTSSYRDFLVIPFNTTNISLDSDHTLDLIIDWSATFNHAAEDLISVDVDLSDGKSCASLTRDDNLGGTGSGGSVCLFKNLTAGTSYNITAQILSTPAGNVTVLDDFKIFVKEFIQDDDERQTTSFFTSAPTSFGEIDSFNISNVDHASVDIFAFISTEINPTSGNGNIEQQINIINGDSQTGVINENTILVNERRITMNQEVLSGASIDTYTIQYNGSCSATTCNILSGEMTAYFANIIPAALNSFEVYAYDAYDGTIIQDFNVTLSTGTIYPSVNGTAIVFGSGNINLTISSAENGGYIDETVTHDTSTNLNQSINQTNIMWDCWEKVSGNNLNCTSPTETDVFNYNVAGNPHSQSVNVSGYYERIITSITVTALQESTLNATDFYSTNLTLESTSSLGTPTSCNYTITGITYSSYSEIVSGSPNTTIGLINGSYSVLADCSGFAYQTQNITIENTTQTLTFDLLTTNSFNFVFRDAQTLNIIDYENVTLDLISNSYSENFTTTNGTLYVDLLSPEFYTIRFDGESYSERFYYFSLEDRSFNNITLYLLNESNSVNVTITIVDDNDKPLHDAYLKVLRYDLTTNTYLLQEIFKTDVEGKAYVETELGTEFYKFFVDYPFGTTVYTSTPQYIEDTTFILPIILNPLYGENFFKSIGVSGNIVFNETTNSWRWDYSDSFNTISGACLYVYETGLVTNSLLDSNCADTSSGTILVSMTPQNGTSYTAVGVILYDTTEYYWGEKSYKAGGIQEEDTKKYRLSLILFLTLAVMLLFAWNLSLLFVFTPMPLLIASLANYVEFSKELSLGFMIGGLVLTYWINKKG